jgi:hypothetical protein
MPGGTTSLYKPPTRISILQIPYAALVAQADPYWSSSKHRELAYVFAGRAFFYDPYTSGPYAPASSTSGDFSSSDFDSTDFST